MQPGSYYSYDERTVETDKNPYVSWEMSPENTGVLEYLSCNIKNCKATSERDGEFVS